jgi:tetratricopeptide (TPR) repeat protein
MPMNPRADLQQQNWKAVRKLFDELVDLSPPAREAALSRAKHPEEVVREASALLVAADAADGFLELPSTVQIRKTESLTSHAYRSLAEGVQVGAFRVEGLIGRGGQGEVYRAVRADGQFDQTVALKLLRPEAAEQFERFRNERQILAGLEHPGIARLIDGGTAPDSRPYIAMEFVEGLDITAYCRANRLGVEARLALFQDVCAAVAYAHRNLIVHRDLKPGNVLVTADGQAKLLDFGIARILAETNDKALTAAILTPEYAAPEQFEGRRPTTATDVYALGAILFELLTGHPPWRREGTAFAGALRMLQDEPPHASKEIARMAAPAIAPQKVRGDLDAIILKAMRYEPEQRYESVAALSDDIDRHLTFLPVRARSGNLGYRARRFLRRNRGRLAAAVAVMLALSVGGGGFLWQSQKAATEREAARVESAKAGAVRDYVMLMLRTAGEAGGSSFATAKQVLDRTAAQLQSEQAGPPQMPLFRILGELYAEMDDFSAAAPLLERYASMAHWSGDPAAFAQARQLQAAVEIRRGNLDAARKYLDEAKAFWSQNETRYAREMAEAAGIEAGLLRERGRREDAIVLLRDAIARSVALLGSGSAEVAALYHNLGVHLLEGGRIDEASGAFTQAWHLLVTQGRTRSAVGIGVLGNRAAIALKQGDAAGAEAMWREAIGLRRGLYGPSTAVAALELNLGRMLLTRDRAEEALPILDDAIAIAVSFASELSPVTIVLRQSRATALLMLNRSDEAETEITRTLASSLRAFGPQHVYHALGLTVRALLHWRRGNTTAARADLDTADAILASAGAAGESHLAEVKQLRKLIEESENTPPAQSAP